MATSSTQRHFMGAYISTATFLVLFSVGLGGLYLLQSPEHFAIWNIFGLVSLGAVGIWRWSWFLLRMLRARYYLHGVFPRWRRRADAVPVEDLPHMCFLVPTYKEQPWITERVFKAIVNEAKTLAQPTTVLVNSSGDDENAAIRKLIKQEDPDLRWIRLIQMTQKDGKRKAMADSLRHLSQLDLPADTVIALMDGDSELLPGTLRRCLPFFRLLPKMGALTTDEMPVVKGSYFFSEWFHLRFAQRHMQMCSDSLSHKVMCLTGRFSLFRSKAALQPSFVAQLEQDYLNDWLWGRFKFLSGDDKSTWYWLLRHKYDMFYVPDAVVNSIETLSGSVVDRAYNNMRRWYGNMLRNNGRAINLGPMTTGWFTWWSLCDQRISFWTCLITPGFLLVSLLQGAWNAAAVVVCWVIASRSLMLMLTFWGRISTLKLIHFPLLLLSQWGGSLVKIWTQMNLAQQKWTNRGSQSISAHGRGLERVMKLGTSRGLLYVQLFVFGIFLCWLTGNLNPAWDITGLHLSHRATQSNTVQVVDVMEHGIWPNDGEDDGQALQTLIDGLDTMPVELRLPIGELDLLQPVTITRGQLTLKGQGPGRTVLAARFDRSKGDSVIQVKPKRSDVLNGIHLHGFTLEAVDTAAITRLDGIRMHQVVDSSVSNLTIATNLRDPLMFVQTENIKVEQVVVQGHPIQSPVDTEKLAKSM
ncbi:glycosyltransferase [Leptothoe spongobia]|uniref:Glycosyltransferase n=1 Tax=Leptothoe spongobia TAU-MAC 1115 TaxID=1967444 RepID=A0A947GG87_9CYAN|nr:glycosyltransferase [Leptothoe spongobia]MBT9314038.1 glycosyltransferase [Leptothoe spongobia TAU-MAC 1115]